ncbi:MAG: ABC transporter permease subunit, partial [Alsobacter sp.]
TSTAELTKLKGELKRQKVPLKRDVVLLAVADEEVDNLGTRLLIDKHWARIGCSHLLNEGGIGIRDVGFRLVAAHVLVTMPYLVRTLIASLTRFDMVLEEAARTLGASPLTTFFVITLPLIRPGLIAGVLFALVVSFDNVSVSLFLTSARTNTLPLAILNYVEYNYDPSIAALSTMLIAVSLGAALLLERLVGLRRVVGG